MMKKYRFLAMFVCMIMLCLAMNNLGEKKSFALENVEKEAPDEIVQQMEMQQRALNAYDRIWQNFEKDENGQPIYPEEYGGEYIQNDKLILLLTNNSSETRQKYIDICKDREVLQFEDAKYSLSYLESYQFIVNDLTREYDIISFGIDNSKNRFHIEVSDYDYEKLLADDRINNDVCNIEIGQQPEALAQLYGGDGIASSTASYSLCIGGTYNSKSAILTAGHGLSTNGTIYRSGSTVGTVRYQRANTYTGTTSYGDFGIVELTGSYTATNKVRNASSTLSIGGTYSSVPVGTTIYKYGASTGYAYGTVTLTNQTVTYSGVYYVSGLTKSTVQNSSGSTAVAGGDSGRCVYMKDGSTYKIHGVVTAGNYYTGTKYTMYSTPIYYAVSQGFTPKTS